MIPSESEDLLPADPELEKTLAQLRKEQRETKKEAMGERQPLLRDLWIPNHQNVALGMVQPTIAANNFELNLHLSIWSSNPGLVVRQLKILMIISQPFLNTAILISAMEFLRM